MIVINPLSEVKSYNSGQINVPQDSLKNGSLFDSTSWIAGSISNYAVAFNGSNYVQMENNNDYNFCQACDSTISVWINTSGAQPAASTDYSIIEKWEGATAKYPYVLRQRAGGASNNVLRYAEYDGTFIPTADTTGSYNDGVWHNIVLVRDKSTTGSIYIYVDTALAGSAKITTTGSISNTIPLTIGKRTGATPFYWAGSLDNLMMYNRVLSAGEIGSLYNGQDVTSSLVGYWAFNEGTGSIAYESSDGNFQYYVPVNGEIDSITFDNNTNFTTGSIWCFVSGTNEQILLRTSGLTNFTVYPYVYERNNINQTGSPRIYTKRVVNGNLRIIGSRVGEATQINNIKINYR